MKQVVIQTLSAGELPKKFRVDLPDEAHTTIFTNKTVKYEKIKGVKIFEVTKHITKES